MAALACPGMTHGPRLNARALGCAPLRVSAMSSALGHAAPLDGDDGIADCAPAFAGLSYQKFLLRHSVAPPLRRKPESRHRAEKLYFSNVTDHFGHWIPACAGMTVINSGMTVIKTALMPYAIDLPAFAFAGALVARLVYNAALLGLLRPWPSGGPPGNRPSASFHIACQHLVSFRSAPAT